MRRKEIFVSKTDQIIIGFTLNRAMKNMNDRSKNDKIYKVKTFSLHIKFKI